MGVLMKQACNPAVQRRAALLLAVFPAAAVNGLVLGVDAMSEAANLATVRERVMVGTLKQWRMIDWARDAAARGAGSAAGGAGRKPPGSPLTGPA